MPISSSAPAPSAQALPGRRERKASRDPFEWGEQKRGPELGAPQPREGLEDPNPASIPAWPGPHLLLHGESVRSDCSAAHPRGRAGSVSSICARPGGGCLRSVPPAARGPRNFWGRGRGRGEASGGRGRGRGAE